MWLTLIRVLVLVGHFSHKTLRVTGNSISSLVRHHRDETMATINKWLPWLGLMVLGVWAEQRSYHQYQVWRTAPLNEDQVEAVRQLNLLDVFDIWKQPRINDTADIMTSWENRQTLKDALDQHGIDYEVTIRDVQEEVQKTVMRTLNSTNRISRFDWNNYYDHKSLNWYIDSLSSKYKFVQSLSIGKSYEQRDMKVIRIAKAGPGKPNVWVEAGIHAREWIAPAVATYLVHELVEKPSNLYLLEQINVFVLPCANPDGYEYSIRSDRMWRKTRSVTSSGCRGVDANRNWGYHYGVTGTSTNPCSDVYRGPQAFSEVEVRNIRDFVLRLKPVPDLALSIHSYSQLWLFPFGDKAGSYPDNLDELVALGDEAVKALEAVNGTRFTLQSSADLYEAAGDSNDWYKAVLGARFAYTVELRDTGKYGFILPVNQIQISGQEMFAAFKVLLQRLAKLHSGKEAS